MAKVKGTTQQALTVKRRTAAGTRPVRRLRGEGLVPGIIYGRDMEPMSVAVSQRELVKLLHAKTGEHTLVTLRLEDGKAWEKPALVQAVQHDPVGGHVLHVDFHAIVLTERLKVKVPVVLKGEPVGVKQDGGVLEQFLREVEVECLPADIPAGVAHDISALKIGDTVHVRDLAPPKAAQITSDPEGVIASVQTPKVEAPPEEAPAVTELEVIREKKEEAGEAEGEEAAKGEKGEKPAEAKKPEPKKDTKG